MAKERGLQPHPTWLNKCIQLYETYLVRHGIMVVGPAGSGVLSSVSLRFADRVLTFMPGLLVKAALNGLCMTWNP